MKKIAVVTVTLSLFLSGCDFGSDRTEVIQRSQQERSSSDGRVVRNDVECAKTSTANEARQSTLVEQPLLLSYLFRWWWWIAYYGAGIVIGIFVYRDARTRPKLAMNIGPIWWCIVTIFEAPLGLLVYWVLNHSELRIKQDVGDDKLEL